MRLLPHPAAPATAAFTIDAEARRAGRRLAFDYVVRGAVDALAFAPRAAPLRTDGLWNATCFEAFWRRPLAANYVEMNFAPSTQWAAYQFTAYRAGMAPLAVATPEIAIDDTTESFRLRAEVDFDFEGPLALALALTAVIVEKNGAKSYWALAHAGEKPDFHAAAGFCAALD